jgi:hypothetical protein
VTHLVAIAFAIAALPSTAACGRKGPPLPPLVRVPQPPSLQEARRVGGEVYVTFTVPSQNVDQLSPADVSRIELLALTTDRPPDRADFDRLAVRVAAVDVAPPPRPETNGRDAAGPVDSRYVRQGDAVTLRETLESADFQPVAVPRKDPPARVAPMPVDDKGESAPAGQADAAPPAPDLRRYYMVAAVTDRGRVSRSELASLSMRMLPPAPDNLTVEYSKDRLTLSWSAATDAVGYYVYRARPDAGEPVAADTARVAPPSALNGKPEASTVFTEEVVFGEERCYQVRAVTEVDGERIEGDASPPKCEKPEDTFPPAAPEGLRVLAATEGITLRWSPNAEPDLGEYLILRGRAGDATLAQIARTPSTQTQYVDRDVTSGVRYVYAIVALDNRAPTPNRSEESARDEAVAP